MPECTDWKDEEFCRLVACYTPYAEAYREVWPTDALCASVWTMASRAASRLASRIAELREVLRGASQQDWVAGKAELMAFLTRVIRTPIGAIDEQSDLAQEVTEVTFEGVTTRKVKSVNRLGAVTALATLAGHMTQAPTSLTINNNLTVNTEAKLEDRARELAELFALPSHQTIEVEVTEV